jgi:hypothetical protein
VPRPKKRTDEVVRKRRKKRPKRQLPPWAHGISPVVLNRLRLLIPSLEGRYDWLAKATPGELGNILARYATFQRLRRQPGEHEADHRVRQARWLRWRRAWERENRWASGDIRGAWPTDHADGADIALGTWIASPEQIAGSKLEHMVAVSSTGRVLVVFDLASDKDLQMERISELIDRERECVGIEPGPRRGPSTKRKKKFDEARGIWPKMLDDARRDAGLEPGPPYPPLEWRPVPVNREQREFLKSLQEHRIVQLWDLQLAGSAIGKLETARALYPDRNEKRSLLAKLRRAEVLQEELSWIKRLRAVVGKE